MFWMSRKIINREVLLALCPLDFFSSIENVKGYLHLWFLTIDSKRLNLTDHFLELLNMA